MQHMVAVLHLNRLSNFRIFFNNNNYDIQKTNNNTNQNTYLKMIVSMLESQYQRSQMQCSIFRCFEGSRGLGIGKSAPRCKNTPQGPTLRTFEADTLNLALHSNRSMFKLLNEIR